MNTEPQSIFCYDCKQFLPTEQFAKRAKSKNGYQPRCLGCASRRINKWKSKKKQNELVNNGQLLLCFTE